MCFDGDGGGDRFVAEFTFINCYDRIIYLHPFLLYEGTDCRDNLEVTLGRLIPQIKELHGANIIVRGKMLTLGGVLVLALIVWSTELYFIAEGNHSATYFDTGVHIYITGVLCLIFLQFIGFSLNKHGIDIWRKVLLGCPDFIGRGVPLIWANPKFKQFFYVYAPLVNSAEWISTDHL